MRQTKLGFGPRPANWELNVHVNVGGPQQIFVQQENNGVVNICTPAAQPAPAAQEPTPAAQPAAAFKPAPADAEGR